MGRKGENIMNLSIEDLKIGVLYYSYWGGHMYFILSELNGYKAKFTWCSNGSTTWGFAHQRVFREATLEEKAALL